MYKIGDLVRVKGQRGRPRKWVVVDANPTEMGTINIESLTGETLNVRLEDVVSYPVSDAARGPDNESLDRR